MCENSEGSGETAHQCAVLPEPPLFAYAISTIISRAGSLLCCYDTAIMILALSNFIYLTKVTKVFLNVNFCMRACMQLNTVLTKCQPPNETNFYVTLKVVKKD